MTANVDIAALVTAAQAAWDASTPGEWRVDTDDHNCVRSHTRVLEAKLFVGNMASYDEAHCEPVDNATFIAFAHNSLPDLLAALSAVAAERDALAAREARAKAHSDAICESRDAWYAVSDELAKRDSSDIDIYLAGLNRSLLAALDESETP